MKTAELSGLPLRWATMKACKLTLEFRNGQLIAGTRISGTTELDIAFEPDIEWDQGGPIIDRADLELMRRSDMNDPHAAFAKDSQKYGVGSTKLIAAMRCIVALRLGDEVDVPEAMMSVRPNDETVWTPIYSPWRHGGWYVLNVSYPSGACGCVSNKYPDKRWRIVCDDRRTELGQPGDHTFKTRDAAARAENDLAKSKCVH